MPAAQALLRAARLGRRAGPLEPWTPLSAVFCALAPLGLDCSRMGRVLAAMGVGAEGPAAARECPVTGAPRP